MRIRHIKPFAFLPTDSNRLHFPAHEPGYHFILLLYSLFFRHTIIFIRPRRLGQGGSGYSTGSGVFKMSFIICRRLYVPSKSDLGNVAIKPNLN